MKRTAFNKDYRKQMYKCECDAQDLFEASRQLAHRGDYDQATLYATEAYTKLVLIQASRAYVDPSMEKRTRHSTEDFLTRMKRIIDNEMTLE